MPAVFGVEILNDSAVAMRECLDQIDWQRPWLATMLHTAESICGAPDWRAALNFTASASALHNHRGLPIRFVPQSALPAGVAYEAFISATGRVPTRDNLHDFFNALVWLTFPRIKVQLNALQAAEIARSTHSADIAGANVGRRGKLRDGATIFDENAALFVTSDAGLISALRDHHWQKIFVEQRDAFTHGCEVYLFGHALMEKLVTPYKAITAHAWVLSPDAGFFSKSSHEKCSWIDAAVAAQLVSGVVTADFTPLPVLGIPGWWPEQNAQFYDDSSVFRLARRVKQ